MPLLKWGFEVNPMNGRHLQVPVWVQQPGVGQPKFCRQRKFSAFLFKHLMFLFYNMDMTHTTASASLTAISLFPCQHSLVQFSRNVSSLDSYMSYDDHMLWVWGKVVSLARSRESPSKIEKQLPPSTVPQQDIPVNL